MKVNKLVNAKQIIQKAQKNSYAIPHFNISNLEWSKAILTTAQSCNSPVIIATTEDDVLYMGGLKTVVGMISNMINDLNILVPVVLHMDHGRYEIAKRAIKAGYTSVMFDGSHLPFEENLSKSKEIVNLAREKNISIELEVGTIRGEEDGTTGTGELADLSEVKRLANLQPTMLASGINNVHGVYPHKWEGLNFDFLTKLTQTTNIPLVLHGGSGIPKEQVTKAISLGIAKFNVCNELKLVHAKALWDFVKSNQLYKNKNYDPKKLFASGFQAMCKLVKEKILIAGSQNKSVSKDFLC